MGAQDRFRTKACPKCGWRGTENSSEKAAGFWQHGGLCAERQCRAAEKRRKKKESDTAIEAEVQQNWAECDSCQKWRLLPSTCIVADGAPFQCADAHRSCEDAGDDEKVEEELEVETPRETAPEAASAAIAEDLFTSAAFSSASMPVTPPTVRKEHVVPGTHCELQEALACIRKIKRNLHHQKISAQRMIHEIEEIDNMSWTPLACTRLHELRIKNDSLRGSYGTSQPEVGVAAALTYFEGKSSKEKSNMIIELLQTLSMEDQDSQTPECLSTVLCSFLYARDKVSEIITSFSDDIVCCNPLDNMITALTQHPARITDKWRLEFTRWCDWSRILTVTPGPNSNSGIRYSKLSKEFCETLRFVCSEQTYMFAIAHMGNDPDSTGLVNLSGPSDTSVRRSVKGQTPTSQAGGCALTLHAYSQALRTAYNAEMPTPLPHVKIELDFTDLLEVGLSKGVFSGEGEARMGDFADGPDLPDRLQWAKALHIHCTLPSSDITSEIDIQLHVYSLVQALQECQAKVLQASERSAHLVKIAKTSQLKEAMQSYSKMPNPLSPTTTHADLLQRIHDGESEFKKFIYISSTMAKNAATLDRIHAVQSEGTELLVTLQEYMWEQLSIAGNTLPMVDIELKFTCLSRISGQIPLFDVKRACQAWERDTRRPVRMIDTHKDAPAVVDVLPDWFARCYRECIRVDAKQVCVILVQDLQRLLPGQPVGHVYVPKLGYGCDQEHALLEKATRMLHKSGITVAIEITDGAFNASRNESNGLPMHVMAKYTMLNKRVDAHTRDVCLSHVQKVVEDLFDIRLEKAELEQTVAGTLPMLPSLQRRRLAAFQNTHANNEDMLGIAHVVLRALQTRAAITEGRSLHVAHLHHTGTELQFGKNIFAKLKEARATDRLLLGIGEKTCAKLAHIFTTNKHELQDVEDVINLVKNTQADHRIASVAFTSIAGLISLSAPPPAHLRNTHTKLDVLRQSAVACLLPAFNAELSAKGVKFDAVLPRDLADVVFTQRKWCGYRKRYISTGQCSTHVFKTLRMAIAHGKDHPPGSISNRRYACLSAITSDAPKAAITQVIVDGSNEMSIPVALRVLSPMVTELLTLEAEHAQDASKKQDFLEAAEYVHASNTYWRACDETGIEPERRIEMLKEVKRYFLRGVHNWRQVPAYVHGVVRGTWIQLLITLDNMLLQFDPAFCAGCHVKWIHPRTNNQDLTECFFSMTTRHRTVDLFEGRVAWTMWELKKLYNKRLGFHKPVSKRKSRISNTDDPACNPHLAGAVTKKKRLPEMKRALGNPHRRGDNGATKNACRLKHARPECDLPQYSKRRVYDMYSELNIEGRNIFQSTTIEEYTKLCDAQASQQQQERAVPQHLPCGTAHPHWLAFREEDPHNPAGPRPISSSDVLCILKHKDVTQAQRNVLLKYQQRQGLKQQFDAQTLLMFAHGHKCEDHGSATALHYLIDGTRGWAEQVGLIRLTGDLEYVACSPDLVLHLDAGAGSFKTVPLEIKCPTPMFGNKFDGRMKIKHLIQVHIQMKAIESDFGYLCYWTEEAGYLYKIGFDSDLWVLVEEGIKSWREVVLSGKVTAPQSPEDKQLYKKVWEQCETIYANILSKGDYTTLPSYVAK